MGFEPIGKSLERDADNPLRHRLYARPVALQFDGNTWQRIEKLVTQIDGGYDIAIPGRKDVIHYRPGKRVAGTLVEAVVAGVHLGDVVNLAAVDDVVQYTIATEGEVERVETGWKLGKVNGVDVGLFFGDWRRKFKEKFTQATDAATGITTLSLDLTQYKAEAEALGAGPGATLNLDPEIVPSDESQYTYLDLVEWHAAHIATSGTPGAVGTVANEYSEDSASYIDRAAFQFIMPSDPVVPTVGSAKLVLEVDLDLNYDGVWLGLAPGSHNYGDLTIPTMYGAIHDGIDATWALAEDYEPGYFTKDITALWGEGTWNMVCFGLMLDADYKDVAPESLRYVTIIDAWIEYELPSEANAVPAMMDSYRRRRIG